MRGLLTSPLGFLIGLSLGALGGGGSILTLPILVYVLHVEPKTAIAIDDNATFFSRRSTSACVWRRWSAVTP